MVQSTPQPSPPPSAYNKHFSRTKGIGSTTVH
jgi:hypothetical protein